MQTLQNCIVPTIRISQEIHCLPHVGFSTGCLFTLGLTHVTTRLLRGQVLGTNFTHVKT